MDIAVSYQVYAYGLKTGPPFLHLFALWYVGGRGAGWGRVITSRVYVIINFLRWTHFMLRYTLLLHFGDQTSCYVAHFCVALRWTHFMLRCTLLLYFGEHTSCYIANCCCTSVTKLHVTLHTSVVLRWTLFVLRCTLLLHFGEHTSCYVAHFCCTSVNTLHVTLHTSVVLRWHTSCYVVHVWVCEPLQRPIYKDCVPCPARQPKGACPYWYNRCWWKACKDAAR